ncbi:MAG: hypothetical protein Q7U78_05915 [Gallionella sp.]|nr:hypothetical protein [Gallionella sp.]
MWTVSHSAAAGIATAFHMGGKYFHLLETVAAVNIRFYRNGAIYAEAVGMEAGFYSQPSEGFDSIELVSATAQAVKFAIADGSGGYNRTAGTVQIAGQQGVMTQAAATVTTASGQLLAARAGRKAVLLQNNHATGNIFVTLDGSAATVAHGIKIAPGGVIVLDVFAPVAAINAIGDIVSNTAVIVVEG